MSKIVTPPWLLAAGLGFAVLAFASQPGYSVGDPPKPDCPKDKSCQNQAADDQIYSLGYWQAKSGAYEAAIATLASAANQSDPRVQTMIGFSLRKLGRVEEAMQYYNKVLAAHPERTTTRQYLGEAFLQIGEPGKAREQLAEIGKRCSTACEDYQLLADEIAKFEKQAG
jgi:predicted Zn-dependent protease